MGAVVGADHAGVESGGGEVTAMTIKIDVSKLLGFRLAGAEDGAKIGAKMGVKIGLKPIG